MEQLRESGLMETLKPRWWVRAVPFLRRLWVNPVFQRNYKRNRYRGKLRPLAALLVGLGFSTFMTALVTWIGRFEPRDEVFPMLLVCLLIPLGVVFAATYIRLFISCLVSTSRDIQRDVSGAVLSPLQSAPLTDSEIYYGECLPNFVQALEAAEILLLLGAGMAVPLLAVYVLDMWPQPMVLQEWYGLLWGLLIAIWLVVTLVLTMLLVSLASGLYSIWLPIVGGVVAALVHYEIVSGFLRTVPLVLYSLPATRGWCETWIYEHGVFFTHPVFIAVNLLVVVLGCLLTARMGIRAFSRARRPG